MRPPILLANPIGSSLLLTQPLVPPNLLPRRSSKVVFLISSRGEISNSKLCCTNPSEQAKETVLQDDTEKKKELRIFQPWDVPWDWKITMYVMLPYLMSIAFTGVVKSMGMEGALRSDSETLLSQLQSTDELAVRMFMDQLLKSVVKLSILYVLVSPYRPFPDDVLSLRWGQPLNLHEGWILWAGGGLIAASFAVFVVKTLIAGLNAGMPLDEADSLVRLLPLIGSSKLSTVCLLGILGILAPVCEETVYRGFLLASLTKWFPLPLSVVLSSAVFALAHQSPGKSVDIFLFGMVLGFIYAQTRNLLAPITMHAAWNFGVILLLTLLNEPTLQS